MSIQKVDAAAASAARTVDNKRPDGSKDDKRALEKQPNVQQQQQQQPNATHTTGQVLREDASKRAAEVLQNDQDTSQEAAMEDASQADIGDAAAASARGTDQKAPGSGAETSNAVEGDKKKNPLGKIVRQKVKSTEDATSQERDKPGVNSDPQKKRVGRLAAARPGAPGGGRGSPSGGGNKAAATKQSDTVVTKAQEQKLMGVIDEFKSLVLPAGFRSTGQVDDILFLKPSMLLSENLSPSASPAA